jgi:hypothetical protein
MSLRGDDRGVVVQVGAVILFGFVILAITMYQVQVVPDQNREIEFNHNERVQDQLLDVRSAIMTTAGGGGSRSVSVTLGTNYPSRTIFLNPSPPYGKLRTVGTTNESVAITVANAEAKNGDTDDFWNGENRSFSTGTLVYEPFYHRYDNAPTTVYENSVVANRFDSATLVTSDQNIVDGRTITLVALNGSLRESGGDSVSVDMKPVSVSSNTIQVANASSGENVTVRIPTTLPKATWTGLLRSEFRSNGGHILAPLNYKNRSGAPNVLSIELEPGTYTLQLSKVGVGSDTRPPEPAYLVNVGGDSKNVPEGTNATIVVEVRDRYNNPVSDVTVNASTSVGSIENATITTGTDGQAVFKYVAPDDIDGIPKNGEINVSFAVDPSTGTGVNESAPANVSMFVTVLNADGSGFGGGGDGGGAYSIDWHNPDTSEAPNDGLSTCSDSDCTWNVTANGDRTLNLTAGTDPSYLEGLSVDYAVNNTSVATVSGDSTTDANGEVDATLTANQTGTVAVYVASGGDSDVINITIKDISSGGDFTSPWFDSLSITANEAGSSGNTKSVDFTYQTSDNDAVKNLKFWVNATDISNKSKETSSQDDSINIDITETKREISVKGIVYDASGNKQVCTGTINASESISLSDMSCTSTTAKVPSPIVLSYSQMNMIS